MLSEKDPSFYSVKPFCKTYIAPKLKLLLAKFSENLKDTVSATVNA